MEFHITDSITKIDSGYSSFFPTKTRNGGKNCFGHVKAETYRWEIALYVDSPEKYTALGGKLEVGKIIPQPDNILSYYSWLKLSGIPTYGMPNMANVVFQKNSKSYLIASKEIDGDSLTVHTLPLELADSADGLSKVSSVCFDYASSWIQYLTERESQEVFNGIKNRLEQFIQKNRYNTNNASIDELLLSILKPSEQDNGMIKEAKMIDYCQLVELWDGLVHPSPYKSINFNGFAFFDDLGSNWSKAAKMYPKDQPSGNYYGFKGNMRERYHRYYFSNILDNARRLSSLTDKDLARRIIKLLKARWRGTGVPAPQELYDDFADICNSIEK